MFDDHSTQTPKRVKEDRRGRAEKYTRENNRRVKLAAPNTEGFKHFRAQGE